MKDIIKYEQGRKFILDYFNNLVKEGTASLVSQGMDSYHEKRVIKWDYMLKASKKLKINVWVGPIKNTVDLKEYDGFSLKVEHPDKKVTEKVIRDLEKIVETKEPIPILP